MIPLKCNPAVNNQYDNYIKTFCQDVDNWLKKGYVGNIVQKDAKDWKELRISMPQDVQALFDTHFPGLSALNSKDKFSANQYIINPDVEAFLIYLRDKIGFGRLFESRTMRMRAIIRLIQYVYPAIKDTKTYLYKVIRHIFVDTGYGRLDKSAFIAATETDVCPYCNRIFVRNIQVKKNTKKGTATIKGQLDHFLSKDKFPYLALCRYNLVPSCPYCNFVKSNLVNDKVISPYDIIDHTGIKFSMQITGKRFTDMRDCASAITISVDDKSQEQNMEDNISEFHLRELYDTHKDYAAEIYYKGKLKYHPTYCLWLKKVVAKIKGCSLTDDDIMRYILGNYTDPKDFNKRPLAKFIHDLAVDAKIIKK